MAAWLARPAVVMVTVFPAVLTVSRKVSWGYGTQIPLAATVLPSEVACAIELRISSLPRTSASPYQDCRAPRSRRPAVATAAGDPRGAAERRLDLAQAGRPVPVVFRRHPASVPW